MHINSKNTSKTALITGASRGIGRAIAQAYAAAGYNLVLTCSRTFPQLQELASQLTSDYRITCLPLLCDMGNFDEVQKVFDQIPSLDVLVNNAGISHIGLLSDMSVTEWQQIMSVNLDSMFYTSKLAIPLMLQNHAGKIINISSVWGNIGASMEVAYSTSKGGVNAFTKALAKELAPSNIQVNAISCGVIETSMNSCFTEDDLEALKNEIPADRIGKPEEVAQLALQLADAPTYMTGQIISIDGGWC